MEPLDSEGPSRQDEASLILTIKIRFVSGKGWDSRMIEWYSGVEWSHVEILYGETTFGAQLRGGVRWRSIHDKCYAKARAYATWEIPTTVEQQKLLLRLITDAMYAPYDWPAIFSFVLGQRRLHLTGGWICSGFMAGVIDSLQLLTINLPWENYEPRDIWMLVPQIPGARRIQEETHELERKRTELSTAGRCGY